MSEYYNISAESHSDAGDVEKGFAESDVVVEDTYVIPRVHPNLHGTARLCRQCRLIRQSHCLGIHARSIRYPFGYRWDTRYSVDAN